MAKTKPFFVIRCITLSPTHIFDHYVQAVMERPGALAVPDRVTDNVIPEELTDLVLSSHYVEASRWEKHSDVRQFIESDEFQKMAPEGWVYKICLMWEKG